MRSNRCTVGRVLLAWLSSGFSLFRRPWLAGLVLIAAVVLGLLLLNLIGG